MSWKEKRLITVLCAILAVLCAAVLLVLSVRYRAAPGRQGGCRRSDLGVGHRPDGPEPLCGPVTTITAPSSLSFAPG